MGVPIDPGRGTDLVWKNELLISEGSWEDVESAAIVIREQVIAHLVGTRAIPASNGLRYWAQVTSRPRNIGLFLLQTAPAHAFKVVRSERVASDAVNWRWPRLKQLELWSIRGVGQWIIWQWRRALRFLHRPVKEVVSVKVEELEAIRSDTAARLGRLLTASWQGTDEESKIANTVALLARVTGISIESSPVRPDDALTLLQKVLVAIDSDKGVQNAIPSRPARWWPALAFSMLIGWRLAGSWRDMVSWFSDSVVTTLVAFGRNWILEPIRQIYLTVRHDPNVGVTIMAKQSLDSDVASLQRMVVDFVQSTTSNALSDSQISSIRMAAAVGDLTPVYEAYEGELRSLWSSILTGKLLRTLLIQVQKTKVDAEVALSSIDRMLQSQQLVLGLVAALPALVFLFLSGQFLGSRIFGWSTRRQVRHSRDSKEELLVRLGTMDALVSDASQKLGEEAVGYLYIEVQLAKGLLFDIGELSADRAGQLANELDRLVSLRECSSVQSALEKIYIKYK